jgi:23S rRNA (uracil1939-C5)-methyltransferase
MRSSHITSLQYVVNNKANDTLYDTDVKLYKGRDYILEEMEGLALMPNHSTRPTLIKRMIYKITRDFAGLTGNRVRFIYWNGNHCSVCF